MRRVFCVGRNYAAHAREMGSDPNREPPFFFTKPTPKKPSVPTKNTEKLFAGIAGAKVRPLWRALVGLSGKNQRKMAPQTTVRTATMIMSHCHCQSRRT